MIRIGVRQLAGASWRRPPFCVFRRRWLVGSAEFFPKFLPASDLEGVSRGAVEIESVPTGCTQMM